MAERVPGPLLVQYSLGFITRAPAPVTSSYQLRNEAQMVGAGVSSWASWDEYFLFGR